MYQQQMYNPYNRYSNYPMQSYTPSDTLQYVNGRQSAEAYIMAPNSRVLLMDSEMARFYLKETDATGLAKITAYDFVEASETVQLTGDYITRQEFEEWVRSFKNESNSQQTATPAVDESHQQSLYEF